MIYRIGSFRLDSESRELLRDSDRISLTPKAFDLLWHLVENPHRVVSRDELLHQVWPDAYVSDSTLNSTVSSLRKALGDDPRRPRYLKTVSKYGYRFVGDLEPARLDEPEDLSNPPSAMGRQVPWRLLRTFAAVAFIAILATAWLLLQVASYRHLPNAAGADIRPSLPSFLATDYRKKALARFDHVGIWPAISPDGQWIAYSETSFEGQGRDIYVMPTSGEGPPIRLTHNPTWEFYSAWSPDGLKIAFWRDEHESGTRVASELLTIDAFDANREASLLRLVKPFKANHFLDWSSAGILFTGRQSNQDPGAVYLLQAEGQRLQRIEISSPDGTLSPDQIALSPDGEWIALTFKGPRCQDLYLSPLQGGTLQRLTFGNQHIFGLAWAPDGRSILFASTNDDEDYQLQLWSVPVQGGQPQKLPLGTGYYPRFSRGGQMVYERANLSELILRVEIDASGSLLRGRPFIESAWRDFAPHYSPQGCGIAFASTRSGKAEVWFSDNENGVQRRLVGLKTSTHPSWSHQGCRIAFTLCGKSGSHGDIYVSDPSGSPPVQLTSHPDEDNYPSWSRDGQWVYFSSLRGGEWQIWKVRAEGGPAVQLTLNGGLRPVEGPQGRFVYYQKPHVDGIWRIAAEGGEEALIVDRYKSWLKGYWALGKNRIFYVDGHRGQSNALYAFHLKTSQVHRISHLDGLVSHPNPGLAISSDEAEIYITMAKPAQSELILVEGWH